MHGRIADMAISDGEVMDLLLKWTHQRPGKQHPLLRPERRPDRSCPFCESSMLDCINSWKSQNGHCCGFCDHGVRLNSRAYGYAAARDAGFDQEQALDLSERPRD